MSPEVIIGEGKVESHASRGRTCLPGDFTVCGLSEHHAEKTQENTRNDQSRADPHLDQDCLDVHSSLPPLKLNFV